MNFYQTDPLSALQAKFEAQKLAFGPIAFQAVRALRDLGILEAIEKRGREGATAAAIASELGLPEYGVKVLAEAGLGLGVLLWDEASRTFAATKVAYFVLHDPMTRANMDFVNDVNYQGFYHLQEAITSGKPAGLRALGNWSTVLANGLAVILNLHHFYDFDKDPAAATPQLIAMWRQIAERYKHLPPTVAFEINNEPHDKATTAVVNEVYPLVIAEIRKSNPARTLFVEPGNWGNIPELKNLVLPPDNNLIVSVHCYDPFHFTHQGTSWGGPDVKVTGFKFPGPPEIALEITPAIDAAPWVKERVNAYNTTPSDKNPVSPIAFKGKLEYAKAWSDHYGRPVHLGEFGCYYKIDPESRAKYYEEFRRCAEKLELGWAIWDWSANFRYWDRVKSEPLAGMRNALFGK